jgi:hypothetical protein
MEGASRGMTDGTSGPLNPVKSREVLFVVWWVIATPDWSGVNAMPNGSPGMVTLRVLFGEYASSPIWHRPEGSPGVRGQLKARPGHLVGSTVGSSVGKHRLAAVLPVSSATSDQVSVAVPRTGKNSRFVVVLRASCRSVAKAPTTRFDAE